LAIRDLLSTKSIKTTIQKPYNKKPSLLSKTGRAFEILVGCE